MLNAVTALEGLLPILPAEAIRQQMVKARQVVVQAAMLAEAPSLSAAAAGGPAEETQPSLLADMLLSPLHHPLATPQLRDRLAALLLQVQLPDLTTWCLADCDQVSPPCAHGHILSRWHHHQSHAISGPNGLTSAKAAGAAAAGNRMPAGLLSLSCFS